MSFPDQIGRLLWQYPLLPRGLSRLLLKRLARRTGADYPFSRDFFGLIYHGNLNNNVDYAVYYHGAFEKHLVFFMRDAMQLRAPDNKGCFVDIGANVGHHSLFMSTVAEEIHSFEPYPPVRQLFEKRIADNAVSNIQVHPVGLSDRNTELPFYAPSGSNAGVGSFDASSLSKGNLPAGELKLVRGDDYIKTLALQRLDIIKMDVEGFEKPALAGLRDTLAHFRPLLIVEITYGQALSFNTVEEIYDHLPPGYTLYTFDKRKANGRKARRRDARSRRTGEYRLVPYTRLLGRGQDDIIACPEDFKLPKIIGA